MINFVMGGYVISVYGYIGIVVSVEGNGKFVLYE